MRDTNVEKRTDERQTSAPLTATVRLTAPASPTAGPFPVAFGMPFPKGAVDDSTRFELTGFEAPIEVQSEALTRWADGSVRWLLVDALLPEGGVDTLTLRSKPNDSPALPAMTTNATDDWFRVDTGAAEFNFDRQTFRPLQSVTVMSNDSATPCAQNGAFRFVDDKGRECQAIVERSAVETNGPVRTTQRFSGRIDGTPLRFRSRVHCYAEAGLVRIDFTLHNPNRAEHPGGLWDLGDPGSIYFNELSLSFDVVGADTTVIYDQSLPNGSATADCLELVQHSSGGENWRSENHVNRDGVVPLSIRGFRLTANEQRLEGLRAKPTVVVSGEYGVAAVAATRFWEEFPKAIETDGSTVRWSLFPRQHVDGYELQGGERKTHAIWLQFGERPSANPLSWVSQPPVARPAPEWLLQCGEIPELPAPGVQDDRLDSLLAETIDGPKSFFARRETIDEFGWRNFGDVFADHEEAYYDGPKPAITHYNNQFDMIHGFLLWWLKTGDLRWRELAEPLARHVIDIDIYHTTEDKAAYNGGLFWFTDHYLSAQTCSHRTYSRKNADPASMRQYGGGPSCQHLFTTGLRCYWLLTGDVDARDAVIGLADWVLNLDDGRLNVFGILDDGPTGSASGTAGAQVPGRGAGNSITALLDGWAVTGRQKYFEKIEQIIRRLVHPKDRIEDHDLLNAEKRWSYTVFLTALHHYLQAKREAEQIDRSFHYARACLLHYARWMTQNERPYLDHADKLEYPTETWAAQEFRKANVLRLAALWDDGEMRDAMRRKADELGERAWRDLLSFDTRHFARPIAIVMVEGLRALALTDRPAAFDKPLALDDAAAAFGDPIEFVPQRRRIINKAKSPAGLLALASRLVNPLAWQRHFRYRRLVKQNGDNRE